MSSIRIIAVPPGIAPLHFREEWVGVSIALATKEELEANPPRGRLGTENTDGYIVLRENAVTALLEAGKNNAAAFWARLPASYLQFKSEVCELVN